MRIASAQTTISPMRAFLISDAPSDAFVFDAWAAKGYEIVRSFAAPVEVPLEGLADLVVLDFRVFGQPLIDLVRSIRARAALVPVLALLHMARATERAAVLDAGADDCLSRSVHPVELRARIRALERRGGREILHLGRLTWDRESRQGEIGCTSLTLSRSQTGILETLLASADELVPISRLKHVLANEVAQTTHNRLYVYICRLRKKLAGSGLRIKSVSGMGYSLGPVPADRSVVRYGYAFASHQRRVWSARRRPAGRRSRANRVRSQGTRAIRATRAIARWCPD